MKATELMIGDYVSVEPSGQRICIAAIHSRKVGYHSVEYRLEWVCMGLLRPIHLTLEILEKNGFRKDRECAGSYFFPTDKENMSVRGFRLEVGLFYFFVTDHSLMPIKYVHELQHALRLMGMSEIADNFKMLD